LASGANDIVVVRQPNGELLATPVNLQIGQFNFEQKSNAQKVKTPFYTKVREKKSRKQMHTTLDTISETNI
jgi:phosphatidate phosphatase PAH1